MNLEVLNLFEAAPVGAPFPVFTSGCAEILDARLDFYRGNARRVPSVTGQVIPEPVFSRSGYQALLERIREFRAGG